MEFKIGDRYIGDNHPVFIVAEMSGNHNKDFNKAAKLIKEAKKAGADAVKIQTYTPDTITLNCKNDYFRINSGKLWKGMYLYDLYQEAYTPWKWQPKLKEIADNEGIILFSSAFDNTAVDLLEEMKVPAYKVASFEIKDLPLLKYIASKNKPVILSSGIALLGDIQEAIATIKSQKNNNIALLKCTSEYPAPLENVNLKTIANMKETFGVITGLSDHTLGISVPIASVALGAKIIEKHFTLKRSDGGPDAKFSLEPNELKELVTSVREAEKAVGKVTYNLSKESIKNREKGGRSLFIVKNVSKGEFVSKENVRSIRPGFGLEPKYLEDVLGMKFRSDYSKGTPLKWELIEKRDVS